MKPGNYTFSTKDYTARESGNSNLESGKTYKIEAKTITPPEIMPQNHSRELELLVTKIQKMLEPTA